MQLSTTVLFDQPRQAVSAVLREKLEACVSARIIVGFASADGFAAIETALKRSPWKLGAFVVGACTQKGFEALDAMIRAGLPRENVRVHLGATRNTRDGARHPFYRYHPMLHSKIYLLEMPNGRATAVIGSHNMTHFAMDGKNCEASVMLEGPREHPELQKVFQHIHRVTEESVVYDPNAKSGYVWWAQEYLDGLRSKLSAWDPEVEYERTLVVLAVKARGLPRRGDIIYFEIPAALHQLRNLGREVHIYAFPEKPPSPVAALGNLNQAIKTFWCRAKGLEDDHGAIEVKADWWISDDREPLLDRTPQPFRPKEKAGTQQVRVEVYNDIRGKYEYNFGDEDRVEWMPVLGKEPILIPTPEEQGYLKPLGLIPPEHQEWYKVESLRPSRRETSQELLAAIHELEPESGHYILLSTSRRKLQPELPPPTTPSTSSEGASERRPARRRGRAS